MHLMLQGFIYDTLASCLWPSRVSSGSTDLSFISPQPDTSQSCKTTSCSMPVYSPAITDTHQPTSEGWHAELALVQ